MTEEEMEKRILSLEGIVTNLNDENKKLQITCESLECSITNLEKMITQSVSDQVID